MNVRAEIELDGQYRALREEAGLVDRSARGKLLVTGGDAAEFLQGQLTNDVEALAEGEGCYAALLDRKGHMRADMRVLRLAPAEIWIDTEPEAAGTVLSHLEMYRIGRDVEVRDVAAEWAILSLAGPATESVLGAPAPAPEHGHRAAELGGAEVRVVATDVGADVLVAASDSDRVTDALRDAGAVDVDEEALEILRVESGRPRFGREMTVETIPQEAGINERAVSFTKGCYIGQETVARLHYKGKPNRHLRGLRLGAPVEAGAPVTLGDREVGRVGSAVLSPALGPIALAILRREAEPGAAVAVGGGVEATVVEPPFAPGEAEQAPG